MIQSCTIATVTETHDERFYSKHRQITAAYPRSDIFLLAEGEKVDGRQVRRNLEDIEEFVLESDCKCKFQILNHLHHNVAFVFI